MIMDAMSPLSTCLSVFFLNSFLVFYWEKGERKVVISICGGLMSFSLSNL